MAILRPSDDHVHSSAIVVVAFVIRSPSGFPVLAQPVPLSIFGWQVHVFPDILPCSSAELMA